MIVSDIALIKQDYARVQAEAADRYCKFPEEVEKYFDDMSEYYTAPLANNYAAVEAANYTEFIHSQIFPADGSWIQFKANSDDNDEAASDKLVAYLRTALSMSGFYSESAKMIKEGVLYNRGFLTTGYSNGLKFRCMKDESMCVSKDSDASNMRAYIKHVCDENGLISEFGRDVYETLVGMGLVFPGNRYHEYTIITAVLPSDSIFFKQKPKKAKQYVAIRFVEGNGELTQVPTEAENFETFPLVRHMPVTKSSLASMALASAVKLNEYEQILSKASRRAVNPTMGVHTTVLAEGNFRLDENGTVPIQADAQMPRPIESTRDIAITYEHIRRLESYINRIFKRELIERAGVTNVSQFENAENNINVLRAIRPSIGDLESIVSTHVLGRVHALLKQHDSKYKSLSNKVDGDIMFCGIQAKIERLRKPVAVARVMQALAPAIQAKPDSAQLLDEDNIFRAVAKGYNCSEFIKSEEEVDQERKEIAKQQQAAQDQEALLAEADAANKLGVTQQGSG